MGGQGSLSLRKFKLLELSVKIVLHLPSIIPMSLKA